MLVRRPRLGSLWLDGMEITQFARLLKSVDWQQAVFLEVLWFGTAAMLEVDSVYGISGLMV